MKNCPSEWTHEDLFTQFSKYGDIESAKVSIDANFNSRGYGFVEFKDANSVKQAIQEMNGAEVGEEAKGKDKKKLIVTLYESKKVRHTEGERLPGNNLYVKNFPKKPDESDFSDDDLRKLFEEFGDIVSAVVMKDAEGKSKGFGFVCFKNNRDAKQALEKYANND